LYLFLLLGIFSLRDWHALGKGRLISYLDLDRRAELGLSGKFLMSESVIAAFIMCAIRATMKSRPPVMRDGVELSEKREDSERRAFGFGAGKRGNLLENYMHRGSKEALIENQARFFISRGTFSAAAETSMPATGIEKRRPPGRQLARDLASFLLPSESDEGPGAHEPALGDPSHVNFPCQREFLGEVELLQFRPIRR
jgi:hypothetical protein